MPFNGQGVYVAPSSPGAFNPAQSGQQATPDAWNALLTDLQSGLSTMICRDGQTTVTADIPFNGHKLTNLADGVANTDATTLEQVNALIAAAIAGVTAPTGAIWDFAFATAPTGWIYCTGTIGNASSGASTRANADTAALFAGFWNGYNNTICPVSGGRGVDAPTDFAAGKTIAIFDTRGALRAAPDAMGGTARNVLGGGVAPGFTGSATAGAFAGAQSDTLDTTKIPAHTHGVTDPGHQHGLNNDNLGNTTPSTGGGNVQGTNPGGTSASATTGITINNTGGGLPHNNTPPTIVVGCTIIKL